MANSRNHVPINLVPAYGRDYKTAVAALADWRAGLDFRICDLSYRGGTYCSCRDFTRAESVLIRYNNLNDHVLTGGLKPPQPIRPSKRRYA